MLGATSMAISLLAQCLIVSKDFSAGRQRALVFLPIHTWIFWGKGGGARGMDLMSHLATRKVPVAVCQGPLAVDLTGTAAQTCVTPPITRLRQHLQDCYALLRAP